MSTAKAEQRERIFITAEDLAPFNLPKNTRLSFGCERGKLESVNPVIATTNGNYKLYGHFDKFGNLAFESVAQNTVTGQYIRCMVSSSDQRLA